MKLNNKVIDDLTESIAAHAYESHGRQFRDEKLDGTPQKARDSYGPRMEIHDAGDLKAHLKNVLSDPDTKYFTEPNGRVTFFNEKTRTIMIFNPEQMVPPGDGMAGTTFRSKVSAGDKDFAKEIARAQERMGGVAPTVHMNDGKWMSTVEKYQDDIARAAQRARDGHIAHSAGSKVEVTNPEEIKAFKSHTGTKAFIDPATGEEYLYNAEKKAMMVIDAKGVAHLETVGAEAKFVSAFKKSAEAAGHMPQLAKGGEEVLELAARAGRAEGWFARHADDFAKLGHLTSKLAKVLPAVGAAAAAIETYQYIKKAELAHEMGIIDEKALRQYEAICCGNGAASLGGVFTSTGGELAARAAFNKWADDNHIPEYLREDLKPSGLVTGAWDAYNSKDKPGSPHRDQSMGGPPRVVNHIADGTPGAASKGLIIGPAADKAPLSPEMQAYAQQLMVEGLEKLDELPLSAELQELMDQLGGVAIENMPQALKDYLTSGALQSGQLQSALAPKSSDPDAPPEMQALAARIEVIRQIEEKMDQTPSGSDEYTKLQEQRDQAETRLAETFAEISQQGGMGHVADYSRDYKLPEAPSAALPLDQALKSIQDALPAATEAVQKFLRNDSVKP